MAPAARIDPELAQRLIAQAEAHYGGEAPEIVFHPQCHSSHGHFAGDDEERAAAFLDIANNEIFDALWFARGGYGSNRIVERVLPKLQPPARRKTYLGYSDNGFLLAALYGRGFRSVAHGPVVADLRRENGEEATARALRYLIERAPDTLEPSIAGNTPHVAFNIKILSSLIGTPLLPDLAGHVVLLEEVSEYLYAIDRSLFHITSNPEMRKVAGFRLGRVSDVPENDRPFGESEEEIVKHWCADSGIAYLGRADIGHDVANKIVPFGRAL